MNDGNNDDFDKNSENNLSDFQDHCLLLEIPGRGTLSVTLSGRQYRRFCLARDTLQLAHGDEFSKSDFFAVIITMIAFSNILGASHSSKTADEKLEEMKNLGMVDKHKRIFNKGINLDDNQSKQ